VFGLVEVELVLKKWGRSFGAVIPMRCVKELNLKENDTLLASLHKEKTPMQLTFGSLKIKASTEKLLADSDRAGWDE
jgi:antitoxin component of MazEF toxin-antitoxin module